MAHSLTQLLRNLAPEEVQELDLSADTCQDQLGWAQLPDLSELAACRQLRKLTVSGWQLESLDVLPALARLEVLDVSDNELVTLEGLGRFPTLRALYASNNLLRTLTGIEEVPSLHMLHADRNELRDIGALVGCSELTHLHLANNPAFRALDPLLKLPKLVFLNLTRVALGDIILLERLGQLEELHLSAGPGLSLMSLQQLRLRVLGIGCQGLVVLELPQMRSLKVLILRNAAMIDALPDLSGCTQLTELRLDGAGIRQIEAKRLPSSLRRLSIKGTPAALMQAEWSQALPAGVEVTG